MTAPEHARVHTAHPEFMVREFDALASQLYAAVLAGKLVQIKIEGEPLIELIPNRIGSVQ